LKTNLTADELINLFSSISNNIIIKFLSKDPNTAADSLNEEDDDEGENNSDNESLDKEPNVWI
jgi:hypothetical protein